jgi:hypothetical protein
VGLADHWQRSGTSTGTLIYFYLHKLSGIILIPVALASIYTQIR